MTIKPAQRERTSTIIHSLGPAPNLGVLLHCLISPLLPTGHTLFPKPADQQARPGQIPHLSLKTVCGPAPATLFNPLLYHFLPPAPFSPSPLGEQLCSLCLLHGCLSGYTHSSTLVVLVSAQESSAPWRSPAGSPPPDSPHPITMVISSLSFFFFSAIIFCSLFICGLIHSLSS